jgi:CRISPR/Cas system-associated exonuclease Cas4 (RecB family)
MMLLTDYEAGFLEHWEGERELNQWARHLDIHKPYWRSVTEWNAHRATECFHPSAISRYFTSQPCKVYLWHQLMGSPDQHTLGTSGRKRADAGTAFHMLMDYYMGTRAQHHGYEYEAEVRLTHPTLYIEGSADGVMRWPLRQPVLWEYKSIASSAFKKATLPHKPYVYQVNTYMGVLGIPVCVICYVIKDSTDFFTVIVHFDQDMWDATVEVLQDVIDSCERDEPPPKNIGSYCKYCAYSYDCFEDVGKIASGES